MAGGQQKPVEPAKAAAEAVREADPAPDAVEFPVERLTGEEAYALTGFEPHVLAGALAGVTRKNLTIDEAKAAVKAWLSTPAQEG